MDLKIKFAKLLTVRTITIWDIKISIFDTTIEIIIEINLKLGFPATISLSGGPGQLEFFSLLQKSWTARYT